jgi:CBS domain-containing protein
MTDAGVGSIVVLDAGGRLAGIVTDRDLRRRVVAGGRSSGDPATSVMSSPVISLSPEASVYEALLEMTRRDIHHLPIVESGHVIGVVSSHDLMLLQAAVPLELARAIPTAATTGDLTALMPRIADTTRRLAEAGVNAYQIGRLVTELNDQVIRRVMTFAVDELRARGAGDPPLPFCWLVLGSEGRREQTLHTDQDNALVYEDPSPALRAGAEPYFRSLAERVVVSLVALGYPPCPGGSMASNPRWCQPLSVWRRYIDDWVREPEPQNLLYSSIYFDLRGVGGDVALAAALRGEIRAQAAAWRSFPRYLAKLAVSHAPPLGLLSRFRLERRDGRRGINVKLNAMLLVVNALRAYAIDLGLDETNTLERLEAATRAGGCFSRPEADDVRDCYETIFLFRLRHQLTLLAAGRHADNLLDPYALARSEQQRLKEAFRAIRRLQGRVRTRYLTEAI